MKTSALERTGAIRKVPPPDVELRFSFKYFDESDGVMCPGSFSSGYTRALMQRMRDLSSWTVKQFTSQAHKTVRNHRHDWSRTTRPNGFGALNEQMKAYEGWQFCLSANAHGRVHGILIDDTFYVIWLDKDHRLYP